MIPQTFERWKKCITEDCGIKLTQEFAQQQLAVYVDKNNEETKKIPAAIRTAASSKHY